MRSLFIAISDVKGIAITVDRIGASCIRFAERHSGAEFDLILKIDDPHLRTRVFGFVAAYGEGGEGLGGDELFRLLFIKIIELYGQVELLQKEVSSAG